MPNDETLQGVGHRIKEQREEYLGLSQEELAKAVGLSRSAISQIELGNRRVSTDEISDMSIALHCSIEYLVKGENSKIPEEVVHLARAVDALSKEDKDELFKFAQFLNAKSRDIKR